MFSKARKHFCGWTHLHSKLLESLAPPCGICIHVDTGEVVKFLNTYGLIFEDFNVLVSLSIKGGDVGFTTLKKSVLVIGTGREQEKNRKASLNRSGCHNIILGASCCLRAAVGSFQPKQWTQDLLPRFCQALWFDDSSKIRQWHPNSLEKVTS